MNLTTVQSGAMAAKIGQMITGSFGYGDEAQMAFAQILGAALMVNKPEDPAEFLAEVVKIVLVNTPELLPDFLTFLNQKLETN